MNNLSPKSFIQDRKAVKPITQRQLVTTSYPNSLKITQTRTTPINGLKHDFIIQSPKASTRVTLLSPKESNLTKLSSNINTHRRIVSLSTDINSRIESRKLSMFQEAMTQKNTTLSSPKGSPNAVSQREIQFLSARQSPIIMRTEGSPVPLRLSKSKLQNPYTALNSIKDFFDNRSITEAISKMGNFNSKVELIDGVLRRRREVDEFDYQIRFEKVLPLIERFLKNVNSERAKRKFLSLTGHSGAHHSLHGAMGHVLKVSPSSNNNYHQNFVNKRFSFRDEDLNEPTPLKSSRKNSQIERKSSRSAKSLTDVRLDGDPTPGLNAEPGYNPNFLSPFAKTSQDLDSPDTRILANPSTPTIPFSIAVNAIGTKRQESKLPASEVRRMGLNRQAAKTLHLALQTFKELKKKTPKTYHHYTPSPLFHPGAVKTLEKDVYKFILRNPSKETKSDITAFKGNNLTINRVEEVAVKHAKQKKLKSMMAQSSLLFEKRRNVSSDLQTPNKNPGREILKSSFGSNSGSKNGPEEISKQPQKITNNSVSQ